ncbi:UvrD-helicase domain-containing protein [bacterium]|jgi:ATP-dependent helicase/nuclease subunit A|nr:UvrD-helicase domain-containing protein [bacterium]
MQLTQAQQDSLLLDKPILVESCAGSGKTTMLVQRILKILRENPDIPLDTILAITYTNKAANEMLQRLHEAALAEGTDSPLYHRVVSQLGRSSIGTIHSFCFRIAMAYPFAFGCSPMAQIMDESQRQWAIQKSLDHVMDTPNPSESLSQLLFYWSPRQCRRHLRTCFDNADLALKWLADPVGLAVPTAPVTEVEDDEAATVIAETLRRTLYGVFEKCWTHYTSLKTRNEWLDYDDLIQGTERMLATNPTICNELQTRYRFILVDEFQDTDSGQWAIIQYLCKYDGHDSKLFLVGDRNQSIYSFRGTHPTLFKDIRQSFSQSDARVIVANDNFRSSAALLSFLNPLFQTLFDDASEPFHPLIAHKPIESGSGPVFAVFPSETPSTMVDQAHFMAQWILTNQTAHPDRDWSDYAILMRRRKGMTLIQDIFGQYGIPAVVHANSSLFERDDIQDLVHVAQLLVEPESNLSWITVLRSPLFGVSDAGIFALQTHFSDRPWMDILLAIPELTYADWSQIDVSELDHDLLRVAASRLNTLRKQAPSMPLSKSIRNLLSHQGGWLIYTQIRSDSSQAIDRLLVLLDRYANDGSLGSDSLIDYLDRLADYVTVSNSDNEDAQQGVQLMTIHKSKGLEFPVVLLPELETGFQFGDTDTLAFSHANGVAINPPVASGKNTLRESFKMAQKESVLDEAKRLFYVACTRAQEQLVFVSKEPKRAKPSFYHFLTDNADRSIEDGTISFAFSEQPQSFPCTASLPDRSLGRDTSLGQPSPKPSPDLISVIKPNTSLTPSGPVTISVSDVASLINSPETFFESRSKASFQWTQNSSKPDYTSATFGSLVHSLIHRSIVMGWPLSNADIDRFCDRYGVPRSDAAHQDVQAHLARAWMAIEIPLGQSHWSVSEGGVTWGQSNLIIKGRVDLAWHDETTLTITDFKTSKGGASLERYRTQFACYALAFRNQFPELSLAIKGQLIHTNTGNIDSIPFSNETLDQFQSELMTNWQAAQ